MIEIEVKAKCNPQKVKEILGKPEKIVNEVDYYFNHPCKDFSQTDEAFRIRIVEANNERKIEITYKGPKIDTISKSREEITIKIDDEDFEQIKKLFTKLGFKEVGIIRKRREIFKKEEINIYLDYVEGYISGKKISLGWFVEVEAIAGEYSQKNALKVLKIIESLTDSPPIRKSYLELVLDG